MCRRCGSKFPIGEFPVQSNAHVDGSSLITHICRPCKNARNNSTYPLRREKVLASCRSYRLRDPVATKLRKQADYQRNKVACNARSVKWARENPEKRAAIKVASEIARRKNGWSRNSRAVRVAIAQVLDSYRIGDQYWDVYESCLIDKPTIDHIVPLASGGSNDPDNLVPTSLSNNSSKSTNSILLWMLKKVNGLHLHRATLCRAGLVERRSCPSYAGSA